MGEGPTGSNGEGIGRAVVLCLEGETTLMVKVPFGVSLKSMM